MNMLTCSIKAVRMLKHNARWAVKLAKREAQKRAREERVRAEKEAEEERLRKERETNPFSMKNSGGSNLFGASLFDEPAAPEKQDTDAVQDEDDDDDDDDDYNEEERLAEEMTIKASLDEQHKQLKDHWAHSASHYTAPLYLNTIPEPEPEPKAVPAAPQKLPSHVSSLGSGDTEEYEKMVIDGMDHVFERFTRRLGSEARQVVRYEYGGAPLAFTGAGALFQQLWPNGVHGDYDASAVPPCPQCGAPRVFELQLMPNLANLLRVEHLSDLAHDDGRQDAEARRQAEVASVLGLKNNSSLSDMRTGIAWSTAMIFVCSRDCCLDATEGYAVEWVGLQHESTDL